MAAKTLSQVLGFGIKSIQRGFTIMQDQVVDVTLTAVDMSKTVVGFLGQTVQNTSRLNQLPFLELTSTTNLKLTRLNASGADFTRVAWEVVEYHD